MDVCKQPATSTRVFTWLSTIQNAQTSCFELKVGGSNGDKLIANSTITFGHGVLMMRQKLAVSVRDQTLSGAPWPHASAQCH
jgi:hypothetical protein